MSWLLRRYRIKLPRGQLIDPILYIVKSANRLKLCGNDVDKAVKKYKGIKVRASPRLYGNNLLILGLRNSFHQTLHPASMARITNWARSVTTISRPTVFTNCPKVSRINPPNALHGCPSYQSSRFPMRSSKMAHVAPLSSRYASSLAQSKAAILMPTVSAVI